MLKINEPMSKHCSLRSGGATSEFFQPTNIDELSEFLKNNKAQALRAFDAVIKYDNFEIFQDFIDIITKKTKQHERRILKVYPALHEISGR